MAAKQSPASLEHLWWCISSTSNIPRLEVLFLFLPYRSNNKPRKDTTSLLEKQAVWMHNLLKINIVKMTFSDQKSAFLGKKIANGIQCVLVQAFSCPNKECPFLEKIGVEPRPPPSPPSPSTPMAARFASTVSSSARCGKRNGWWRRSENMRNTDTFR